MRVRIGIRNYKVVFHDEVLVQDDERYNGWINYSDEVIDITRQQTLLGQKQTLMHEIIHSFMHNLGYQPGTHEEVKVDGLATQMLEFLRRNPDVVQYLRSNSKEP